jgi:predicted RNA-binding protein associated with RNAse of E/G family
MFAMKTVIMKKLNPEGRELWRYSASLKYRDMTSIHLEAPFNGRELELMGVTIKTGDIFKEIFFTDRWYNIFAIHDKDDGTFKGWYCNIGMPVVEEGEGEFSYVDLALDLWVDCEGKQTILDEDEFNHLELEPGIRNQAKSALEELMTLLSEKNLPQNKESAGVVDT